MVLNLNIEQIAPEIYEVRCESHTGSLTSHQSVSEALAYYGAGIPPDFAQFVELRYADLCLGTVAVSRLAREPETVARELMALAAAVHAANSSLAAHHG